MSTVINILSPHVADLIAAGEVVERPASVVKELVENAIDAGARNVTVALENGGMRSIRVTDDGCGMSPEDAGVAFLRHATSKLRDERGLEAISTLGFRGEALAAISAVSRIELVTRERGAAEGTRVVLTAGEIDEMGPVGAPEGTTMLVRDLFYNTPARRKFLKSDRAEGSACAVAALKCALGHPEVSVRLLRDGAEVFFSPGDGQKKSAVYALLGRDLALGMLSCVGASEGLRVEGYVSAPHACRGNRAMQFFFLNGRCFRSVALQTALEQAYKNSLLTGRYPACALWLTYSPGKVDVNVHPTKSEVKFSEERLVFETLYAAVRAALDETTPRHTAEIRLSPGTRKAVPRGDFYQSMSAAEFREGLGKSGGGAGKAAPRTPVREQVSPAAVQTVLDLRSPTPEYRTGTKLWTGALPPVGRFAQAAPEPASPVGRDAFIAPQTEQSSGPAYPNGTRSDPAVGAAALGGPSFGGQEDNGPPRAAAPTSDFQPDAKTDGGVFGGRGQETPPHPTPAPQEEGPSFRVIGEALDTYILVETGDALLLIDKHAAHERMNFDRLRAGLGPQMSQTLLTPLSWSPGADTAELLEQNADALEAAGFELERFGEDGVILRAVPADLIGGELAALEELAEALKSGPAGDAREEILHTVACKAAIKAGSRSDPAELEALAAAVVSGQVRYCPHGRPVSVRLTKAELDKQFKRIV